jgi:acetyl-CoA carboxylase alpha subunit
MAVDVLKSRGVPEDHILFLNLIASPEGAKNFAERFPKLRVVTAFVDQGLDEKKYTSHFYPEAQANKLSATLSQALETLEIASTPCKSLQASRLSYFERDANVEIWP